MIGIVGSGPFGVHRSIWGGKKQYTFRFQDPLDLIQHILVAIMMLDCLKRRDKIYRVILQRQFTTTSCREREIVTILIALGGVADALPTEVNPHDLRSHSGKNQ